MEEKQNVQVIFNRRAGHGNPHLCLQFFDFACLFRARIFDCLCLIENHAVPHRFLKCLDA